jgi:hypothetical protein
MSVSKRNVLTAVTSPTYPKAPAFLAELLCKDFQRGKDGDCNEYSQQCDGNGHTERD